MIGYQFKPIFELLCPKNFSFLGVYSSDEIPKRIKVQTFFIFNTAKSSESGLHWIAIYKSNLHTIEVFDPLGTSDIYIKSILGHLGRKFLFLSYPTQPSTSKLCGEYCIYFIVNRLFNTDQSFQETIDEIFSKNTHKNEKKIIKFIALEIPSHLLDG